MFVDKVFLLHSLELLQEFLEIYSLHMFTVREVTGTFFVTERNRKLTSKLCIQSNVHYPDSLHWET